MDKCQYIYVGSESLHADFCNTLRNAQGVNGSVACMLFEDGTQLDELVNELERFIKYTVLDVRVVLDIAHLFKFEGAEECQRVLKCIEEYLVFHSNVFYAFSPPVLTPHEQHEQVIKALQVSANEMNVCRGISPLYSFRWVMNLRKGELCHVNANWTNQGSQLSLIGSTRYFKGIWRYLSKGFSEPHKDYNLTPRIARKVNTSNPVGHGRSTGNRSQASNSALHSVSSGRVQKSKIEVDLRVKLAMMKIGREMHKLERLESGRNVQIPNNVRNMMKNVKINKFYY